AGARSDRAGGSTQGGGAVHGLERRRHQAGGGGVAQERRRAHHAAAGRGQALPRLGRAGRDIGAVRQSKGQGRLRGVAGGGTKVPAITPTPVDRLISLPVVPADAGTHNHQLWNMGPRLRGDDGNNVKRQIRSKLLASTTAVHLAMSSTMRARNSSGLVGRGSLPSARRRSTTIGSLRRATTSAFKRLTIAGARPAGASKPCQPVTT